MFPAIFAAPLCCAPLFTADAADWKVVPRLSLQETYSDNITLAPAGSAEDDFVTEVNPGISLTGRGRRLKLGLDYRMQNLLYLNKGSRNRIYHQLAADANAELVSDHLFLDVGADIGQQLLSPSASVPLDNVSTGNRTNVYSYRLSPYYRHDLGGYVDALLRYTYADVRYAQGASDASSYRVDVNLAGGRKFTRLNWNLRYYDDRLIRSTADDVKHRTVVGDMRFRLLSTLFLLAQAGNEHHDFKSTSTQGYRNGSYGAAGIGWQPGRRFRLDLLYGNRYKSVSGSWQPTSRTSLSIGRTRRTVGLDPGTSWNGSFSLRTRRTIWQASYLEDTVSTQALQIIPRTFLDPFTGNPVSSLRPGQIVILLPDRRLVVVGPDGFFYDVSSYARISPFELTDEVFTRKRGQASLGIQTGKSTLLFAVFNERRDYLVSEDEQRVYGGSASWDWRFAGRTSLLLNGGIDRMKYLVSGRRDTLWYLNAGLSRKIRRNLDGSLTYRYTTRDSSAAGADYRENRLVLSVNMRF